MKRTRPRPTGVPAGATWTPARYWVYADRNARVGRRWNEKGRVICEWTLDAQGKPHGRMRSWYGTGQLEAEGSYVHGVLSGVQVCFAAQRGKSLDATLKASPKIFRLERVWVDGKVRGEEYFDQEGNRVDARGRPASKTRQAQQSARAIGRRFQAKAGETFEIAMDRSRRWAEALKESGHDVASEPMRLLGRSATKAAIARIERSLGTSLPGSYRRFLLGVGALKSTSGQTVAPDDLVASAHRLQRTLDEMLRDLRSSRAPAPRVTAWAEWSAKARYLPDRELLAKSWLVVAEEGHRLFAMAPHLDGAPIFEIYTDDAIWLSLVGDFDALVSQLTSEMIAEVTHQLGH